MKLSRFLTIAMFLTVFSLLYVYQQTEVFRLAYMGQKKQVSFEDLLDKNCLLRYNIEKNASLVSIGDKISGYADFQMPDNYQLVRVFSSPESRNTERQSPGKPALLSRIFGTNRQAEARTLNP